MEVLLFHRHLQKPWTARSSPHSIILSNHYFLEPARTENSENFYGSFEICTPLAVISVCLFQQIIYKALARVPTFQLLLPWEMGLGRETGPFQHRYLPRGWEFTCCLEATQSEKESTTFSPTLSQPEAEELEGFGETSSFLTCQNVLSRSIPIDLCTYMTRSLLSVRFRGPYLSTEPKEV